jgi:hypothetical protein
MIKTGKRVPVNRAEGSMYVIVRRYRTSSGADVSSKVGKEFVPVISKATGFQAYYVVDEGFGHQFSISIFEDREAAEISNKLAADWVRLHPHLLPEPPEIFSGEVAVHKRLHREDVA